MKFLSLLAALLLEQASPLREGNRFLLWFNRYALVLEGSINGGQYRHGVIAWALAVAPALGVTAGYRHTSRGDVRIQPELVIRVAAEVGAVTWSTGAQIAVSLPWW